MKLIDNIGSIQKNNNRLVSSTYSDWSVVREGTFVKFNNDVHFYTVSHTEKRIFLKDFIVKQPNLLQINEDCGVNIGVGDSLKISFKEYELDSCKIIGSGRGYKVGDKLTLEGGSVSLNVRDNMFHSCFITVTQVTSDGQIVETNTSDKGKYLTIPGQHVGLQGGFGAGATAEVSFKLTDHRTFTEKDVKQVEFKNAATLITLEYPLQSGVIEGKLSIEKWEIVLSSSYLGETNVSEKFEIIRDFTPHLNIPLMSLNAPNPEMVFNKSIAILDKKIAELEKRIESLEDKSSV